MSDLFMRMIISYLSGYFLSISGSLSQLSTHNPLSSPSTLGFTGFGVLLVIISYFIQSSFALNLGIEQIGLIFLPIALAILFILYRKRKEKHFDLDKIVVIGIAFNLFIGAIFSVIQFLLISKGIRFPENIWFGSFRHVSSQSLVLFIFLFLLSQVVIRKIGPGLEFLNFGVLFARAQKVDTKKIIFLSLFLSLALTCVVVIYFGVFSFVGLVIPHLLRSFRIFKYSIKNELYWGSLISGFFIFILDFLCYNFTIWGAEIPVGMLSAIVGSFSLIFIVFRSNHRIL